MATRTSLELGNYLETPRSIEQQLERNDGMRHENTINAQQPQQIQGLEPTDGGPSAWKLLFGAFAFEAVLWGFALSFGVFQNYYSRLPQFADNKFIPYVGSTSTALTLLAAPFMAPLVRRFPKYQRHMIWLGWPICIMGILAGSFMDTLLGLIMTQGVMYGVGFAMFYYPIISMVNEWWVIRRGFAWGMILSSSGASGAVFPFIVDALLHRYGYKITLRVIAVAMIILTGPLLPLFKGRLPAVEQSVMAKTNWSFLRKPLFWIYCTSNVAQGLGFYLPQLHLPSFATLIGLSATKGALLAALMSIAQVAGQFTFGFLSDGKIPLNALILSSALITAASSLIMWGLAHSLLPLIFFALTYGFFGYGYLSMRVRMGTAVTREPTAALVMFAIFCFGQGVGNVLAGPISGGLLLDAMSCAGYGASKYKPLVIFTGCTMVTSALSIVCWYLRPSRWTRHESSFCTQLL